MPRHHGEENAAIKRHDGKHHQIRQPGAQRVETSLQKPHRDAVRAGLEKAAVGKQLDEDGENEDAEQREGVHDRVVAAGPT